MLIKNTVWVNQELSLEAQWPLVQAQLVDTRHLAYIHALETELAI